MRADRARGNWKYFGGKDSPPRGRRNCSTQTYRLCETASFLSDQIVATTIQNPVSSTCIPLAPALCLCACCGSPSYSPASRIKSTTTAQRHHVRQEFHSSSFWNLRAYGPTASVSSSVLICVHLWFSSLTSPCSCMPSVVQLFNPSLLAAC